MSFFDKYSELCRSHKPPLDPCGRQIARLIGINNSTATTWKQNGTTPKGETIRVIADYFSVSADYLLETNAYQDSNNAVMREKSAVFCTTPDEERLLICYRMLNPDAQQMLLSNAEAIAGNPNMQERPTQKKETS